jgi:hypothetical protein
MPIVVTFDIHKPTSQELNRIRGFFERLGWEHLGNTAYRYPKLHGQHATEDWFNHVIPALMLLRSFGRFAAESGREIQKYTIDVQSSTGFDPVTGVGTPPLVADEVTFSQPSLSGQAFGLQRLRAWLDQVPWPYQQPSAEGAVVT